MEVYPFSPSDDRQAWFELSGDLGAVMEQLDWIDHAHIPEPFDAETRRAVRHYDWWDFFSKKHSESLRGIVEEWCFSNNWSALTNGQRYLLQLRSFTAATFVEHLYTGPGKSGETYIPFPHHVLAPVLRRWWLTEWFDSKGQDVLFWQMQVRFWPTRAKFLSPALRQSERDQRP